VSDDHPQRPGVGLKPGDDHYRAWVGPPENYDLLSALQFNLLTHLGLRDYHQLLDVGCGSLRAGRLFIPYLLPGSYFGIEPEPWLIEEGVERELGQDLIRIKQPRFDHNREFDFSVFTERFDFILAQSVLTHAGRAQIHACFSSVKKVLAPEGVFAVTYIPGKTDHPDDEWVYPGVTRFTSQFMTHAVASAGLELTPINWHHPGVARPTWLAVGHPGLVDRLPKDMPRAWDSRDC